MSYDPTGYWRETLKSFDEAATAYPWLPVEFNRALYERWNESLRAAVQDLPIVGRHVLDVGAGSGVLVRLWHDLGAATVTAIDLAPAAVDGLRALGIDAHVADIGDPGPPFERRFDIVSAASVLLHIPDTGRFRSAVSNIAAMLEPSGFCVCVDPYIRRTYRLRADGNSTARTAADWQAAASAAGLKIISVSPLSALLANPMDTGTAAAFAALQSYWHALERCAAKWPRLGTMVARALTPVDRAVCATGWSPSAKVIVLRRSAA